MTDSPARRVRGVGQRYGAIRVIGQCQHCGVKQFDNPHADPALDAMADLCWKCVQPWKKEEPCS